MDPTNKLTDYQTLISSVLENIENKEKLSQALLENCVPKISAYDYESNTSLFTLGLIFCYELLAQLNNEEVKRSLLVLEIVKSYVRISPRSQREIMFEQKSKIRLTNMIRNVQFNTYYQFREFWTCKIMKN